MGPRRGAAIALASGLGVLTVLGIGIIFRRDLAAAWHLHRLRTDEGHLARIIDAPEGSAADLAIRRWAETRRGQEALFLIFAEEAIGAWLAGPAGAGLERAVFILSEDGGSIEGAKLGRGDDHLDGFGASVRQDARRLQAVCKYLPRLVGRHFTWAHHPDFRFSMMDAASGFRLLGIDVAEHYDRVPPAGDPACLVERVTKPPLR